MPLVRSSCWSRIQPLKTSSTPKARSRSLQSRATKRHKKSHKIVQLSNLVCASLCTAVIKRHKERHEHDRGACPKRREQRSVAHVMRQAVCTEMRDGTTDQHGRQRWSHSSREARYRLSYTQHNSLLFRTSSL